MNKILTFVIPFTLGAATGSLVAWRTLKTKYEKLAQQEIDSYKEYMKERYTQPKETPTVESESENMETGTDTDILDEPADELVNLLGSYRSDDDLDRKEEKQVNKPYVIMSEDYDDNNEYDKVSLNYYADGVLTDEWDNVIHNAEDIVGDEALTLFGEAGSGPDTVYVRNDDEECDYEILRDTQTYAEAMGTEE